MSEEENLKTALAGLGLAEIRYYDRVGSTNEVATTWLNQGAPDLALVAADEQTAGRGRFDRRWVTRPGAALAFSLVLRPEPREAARSGFFAPPPTVSAPQRPARKQSRRS